MSNFSAEDFNNALKSKGGVECSKLLKDPKLWKAAFDILKSAGELSKGGITAPAKVVAIAANSTSGANAITKTSSASSSTKNTIRSVSFAISEFKATTDLISIAKLVDPVTKATNTGAALALVGAQFVQKTGLMVSMTGGDSEKAKCIGAVMELSASAAATAITAPTGVFAVLAAASLVSSSVNSYQSCQSFIK